MALGKRLAVFLDGTWNTVSDNTNVWRLSSLCAPEGADGRKQLIYYNPGVGTKFGERVRGGALGYGLDKNILDGYRWLIENYDEADEVFIFGFSRGAYTARSLAGLIATCGLLRPGAPMAVDQVYDRYRCGAEPLYRLLYAKRHGKSDFDLGEKWLLEYSFRIPIKLIGVWDTVGELGVPFGDIPGLSRRSYRFLNTHLSNIYENAYHALAVDEHRNAFSPTLWTKFTPKDAAADRPEPDRKFPAVEQRWFIGAHANVGGGCRSDLLAQIPLAWLMGKAQGLGLEFRFGVTLDGNEDMAPISDSYGEFLFGLYRLATLGRRHFRTIDYPRQEKVNGWVDTVNETIDRTVFDRWRRDATYRPPNLVEWAQRHSVDPSNISQTVSAADPTQGVAG